MKAEYDKERDMYVFVFEDALVERAMVRYVADKHGLENVKRSLDTEGDRIYLTRDDFQDYLKWVG